MDRKNYQVDQGMNRYLILSVIVASVAALNGCENHTAAVEKLDDKKLRVSIMTLKWPSKVVSNTAFVIDTKIFNSGQILLPSLGKDGDFLRVGVSYHWRTADEKISVWDGFFTPLTADLDIGVEQVLPVKVWSPQLPGKYILEMDLLQNSAFWFSGIGSQTARMIIDVS